MHWPLFTFLLLFNPLTSKAVTFLRLVRVLKLYGGLRSPKIARLRLAVNEKYVMLVFYELYPLHCSICIVFFVLYSLHFILCNVFYGLHYMQCFLCIVSYALFSMHSSPCNVFYVLYSMQCIPCIVF